MKLPLHTELLQYFFLLIRDPGIFVKHILLLSSADSLGDRPTSYPASHSRGSWLTAPMPSFPSLWPQNLQGRGWGRERERVFNNNTVKGSVLAFLTWAHRWGQCGISYAPAAVRGSSWTCGTRHTQTSGWWGGSADGAQTYSSSCRQSCKKRIRTLKGPQAGVRVWGAGGQEGRSGDPPSLPSLPAISFQALFPASLCKKELNIQLQNQCHIPCPSIPYLDANQAKRKAIFKWYVLYCSQA